MRYRPNTQTKAHYPVGPSPASPPATWRPSRASAPCAPLALHVGLRGPATWPCVPRRIRPGPACRVSSSPHQLRGLWSKIPLFVILVRKNQFKNKIKIRKRHKLHKFITLDIQLLFNPNFLHWITNFFLFNIMSFKIYFQRRN